MLGASPEVATLAVMYLRVRCCACPAFLLYNVGTGNFRGRKDTRTPLLAYVTTNSLCVSVFHHTPSSAAPAFGLYWLLLARASTCKLVSTPETC